MESRRSARWKTSPANMRSPDVLEVFEEVVVEGTVACAAGPSAALKGVAGTVADCGEDPLTRPDCDAIDVEEFE